MPMKKLAFLALIALGLSPRLSLAELALNELPIEMLNPVPECKLSDATTIKLLYLHCVARKEDADFYEAETAQSLKQLNCLNPELTIGGLSVSQNPPVAAPKHIRKARLALHALQRQILSETPDPLEIFRSLQAERLEKCPVKLRFDSHKYASTFGTGPKFIEYTTDLADALGLSLNASTVSLLEKIDSDEDWNGLNLHRDRGYYALNENLDQMEIAGNRRLPQFQAWLKFLNRDSSIVGFQRSSSAISDDTARILLHTYGAPKMTEARIVGSYADDDGDQILFSWFGTTLWRAPLSSLIPAEEKARLFVSDLVIDANPRNDSLVPSGSGGSQCSPKNKECKKWITRGGFKPNNEEK
jgi:hypothetical protein